MSEELKPCPLSGYVGRRSKLHPRIAICPNRICDTARLDELIEQDKQIRELKTALRNLLGDHSASLTDRKPPVILRAEKVLV